MSPDDEAAMCDQDHYDDDLKTYSDAKNVLKETYAKANLPAEAQAEKAWARMLVLFKKALA